MAGETRLRLADAHSADCLVGAGPRVVLAVGATRFMLRLPETALCVAADRVRAVQDTPDCIRRFLFWRFSLVARRVHDLHSGFR
jgi:hypothetical protein